ncbi:hypothetical protein JCM10449v2_004670 [Rhodotorula kratochvilovae]
MPANALLPVDLASPSDGRAGDSDSPAPSTSSLLTATAGRNASTSPHPHAHFLSSTLLGADGGNDARTPPSRARSPASSISSLSSLSSRYSLLPLRTFQRLHLVQFALTFLFLFVVPVAVVVALAPHELRWEAFLLGVASWLAGEQLREVVFELFTPSPSPPEDTYDPLAIEADGEPLPPVPPAAAAAAHLALPTVVHALAQEALRLGAVALVVKLLPSPSALVPPPPRPPHGRAPLPPLDPLFWSALWLALGSAVTEILWGSRRLWKQLELYEDVLPSSEAVDEERVLRGVRRAEDGEVEDDEGSVVDCGVEAELATALEGDDAFQRRLRALQRDELEAQLGVPLFEIPVGVVMIWRLDSILLSLVFTLLLSLPFRLTPPSLLPFRLAPTFLCAALAHALLSYAWVARVRTWGIPSVSYGSLVLLVGGLFAVLGAWGVLV